MVTYSIQRGMKIATEFTPETFGYLKSVGPVFMLSIPDSGKTKRHAFQVCQCECGQFTVARRCTLVTKKYKKSCGCKALQARVDSTKKHGKTGTREYAIYHAMKNRCLNVNDPRYPDYGGAGVGLAPEWNTEDGKGFDTWFAHIGPRPSPKHSQDRFPNPFGNYEPGNVRWATNQEQCNNKKRTLYVEYEGKQWSASDLSRHLGFKSNVIASRKNLGWSDYDAIHTPPKYRKPKDGK